MRTKQWKIANNLDKALNKMLSTGKKPGYEKPATLDKNLAEELYFALTIRDVLSPHSPGQAQLQRVEARVLNRLQPGYVSEANIPTRPVGRSNTGQYKGNLFKTRKFLAALLTAGLFSLAGLWSVQAYLFQTLPGETGFVIKERIEDFRLIHSLSPLDEAELLSEYASRRSNELIKLAEENKNLQPGIEAYARTLARWITVLSTVAPGSTAYQPGPGVERDPDRLQEQVSLLETRLLEFREQLARQSCTADYSRVLETGSFLLHQYDRDTAADLLLEPMAGGDQFIESSQTQIAAEVLAARTGTVVVSGLSGTPTGQTLATNTTKPLYTDAAPTGTISSSHTVAPEQDTRQPSATFSPSPSVTAAVLSETPTSMPEYAMGDVNLDFTVTALDALLLDAYLEGIASLTEQQLLLADCVEDSVIDLFDKQAISLRAAGVLETFPLLPEDLPSGDVNQDSQVTPGDALLVEQHLKGIITLTSSQQYQADACWSGHLSAADRDAIFNHYLQLIPSLPILPETSPME